MTDDCIVADSTFFSCFKCNLKNELWLYHFLEQYRFFLGAKILNELPQGLVKNPRFVSTTTRMDFNYYELIKPFFGRDPNHLDDGEYQAIGIAYTLDITGNLHSLILDDRKPRHFVARHFPALEKKMKGTIGFILCSCCTDHKTSQAEGLAILEAMKSLKQAEPTKRPCSTDDILYTTILIPAIEHIRNCHEKQRI